MTLLYNVISFCRIVFSWLHCKRVGMLPKFSLILNFFFSFPNLMKEMARKFHCKRHQRIGCYSQINDKRSESKRRFDLMKFCTFGIVQIFSFCDLDRSTLLSKCQNLSITLICWGWRYWLWRVLRWTHFNESKRSIEDIGTWGAPVFSSYGVTIIHGVQNNGFENFLFHPNAVMLRWAQAFILKIRNTYQCHNTNWTIYFFYKWTRCYWFCWRFPACN